MGLVQDAVLGKRPKASVRPPAVVIPPVPVKPRNETLHLRAAKLYPKKP
jgi:hypothetical protein